MKEEFTIVQYKCDLCGKIEDVNKCDESSFLRITLPSHHYNERKMLRRALYTATFDICENCAKEMLKKLSEHYKISSIDYNESKDLYAEEVKAEIKSEAIKEFAERLTDKIVNTQSTSL